ncbi:MAG: type II toxin-antitoxin system RelE/ParE family toxin [Gammaproteobacteria bacterium]
MGRWYDSHENHRLARAALDTRMTYLRQQNREGWTRPYYDLLKDGVGEVRFKAGRVHHRALGFFGPDRNEFTFCMFATKTKHFDPRNAIELSVDVKEAIERNPSRAIKLKRWGQS